ncbi:multiple stress resistance protein BhsA, partial [Klebsiella pneumoniae]
MKTVNTLAIAAVLSSLSFASFAAVEVQSTPAGQHKVGTISASAGTNLGSLE